MRNTEGYEYNITEYQYSNMWQKYNNAQIKMHINDLFNDGILLQCSNYVIDAVCWISASGNRRKTVVAADGQFMTTNDGCRQ